MYIYWKFTILGKNIYMENLTVNSFYLYFYTI